MWGVTDVTSKRSQHTAALWLTDQATAAHCALFTSHSCSRISLPGASFRPPYTQGPLTTTHDLEGNVLIRAQQLGRKWWYPWYNLWYNIPLINLFVHGEKNKTKTDIEELKCWCLLAVCEMNDYYIIFYNLNVNSNFKLLTLKIVKTSLAAERVTDKKQVS